MIINDQLLNQICEIMKKLFSFLVLFIALSVNAQEDKKQAQIAEFEKNSKQESVEISNFLKLDAQTTENLRNLFLTKYKMLGNMPSQDRTDEVAKIIEAKLRATLTPAQMAQLDNNKTLFNKLVSKKKK